MESSMRMLKLCLSYGLVCSCLHGQAAEIARAYILPQIRLEAAKQESAHVNHHWVSWFDLLSYGVLEEAFVKDFSDAISAKGKVELSVEERQGLYQGSKRRMLQRVRQELIPMASDWSSPDGKEEEQKFDIFFWRLCEVLIKLPVSLRLPFLFQYPTPILREVARRVRAPERFAAVERQWKVGPPQLWEVLLLPPMEEMWKICGPFLVGCMDKICVSLENGEKMLCSLDEFLSLSPEVVHSAEGAMVSCEGWRPLFMGIEGETPDLKKMERLIQHKGLLAHMMGIHQKNCVAPADICELEPEEEVFGIWIWLELRYGELQADEIKKEAEEVAQKAPELEASGYYTPEGLEVSEWDFVELAKSLCE
jgi:hypothetical protein